mgnify:CR=1 FL=1
MIQYYKTVEGQLLEQNCASPGVWIHLNRPTKEEIEEVCAQTGVLVDLLTAALDEEEAARIEREEDQTLVLVDIPVVEPEGTSFVYNTLPLGIVLCFSALETGAIWAAFLIHVIMSQLNDYMAVRANPAMRFGHGRATA